MLWSWSKWRLVGVSTVDICPRWLQGLVGFAQYCTSRRPCFQGQLTLWCQEKSRESVEKSPIQFGSLVPGAWFISPVWYFSKPGAELPTSSGLVNLYSKSTHLPDLGPPFGRAAMLQQVLDSTVAFWIFLGPGFWHQSWLKIHRQLLKFRLLKVVEGQGFTPGPCRFWTMGNPWETKNGNRTTTSELWNH